MEQVRQQRIKLVIFHDKIHCRYLTVFRDLQQVEGRPSAPTEWKGEKDKTEVNIYIFYISDY